MGPKSSHSRWGGTVGSLVVKVFASMFYYAAVSNIPATSRRHIENRFWTRQTGGWNLQQRPTPRGWWRWVRHMAAGVCPTDLHIRRLSPWYCSTCSDPDSRHETRPLPHALLNMWSSYVLKVQQQQQQRCNVQHQVLSIPICSEILYKRKPC